MIDAPLPPPPRWRRRLALVALAAVPASIVHNGRLDDVCTYFRWHQAIWGGQVPYRDLAFEYPPLALVPVLLPGPWVHAVGLYAPLFMATMWLCDLVQKVTLYRACAPARRMQALVAQTAIAACLYFTYLKRFDVCVATLAVLAVARLAARPGSRGAWAWWGTAVACKLIPAFLAPSMVLYARTSGVRPRRIAGQLAVGAAAVALPFALAYAVAGPRSLDWLGYHRARGLQVGSAWVSAMLAGRGLGTRFALEFRYGALHLTCPWAHQMARLADLVMPAAAGLTALAMARRPRPGLPPPQLARACLAVLLAVLATGKVLSPQFIAWLVPLAVLAAFTAERRDWVLVAAVGSLAALTAQVYPGEAGLANGIAHRQAALVARGALLWVTWAYLLVTPRGPVATPARDARAADAAAAARATAAARAA